MKVKVPDVGQGFNQDTMAEELAVGVWSSGYNMRPQNGFMERFHGIQATFTQPSVIPYYLDLFSVNGTRYSLHAGLTSVFVDDGTTQTDITGTAPTGAIDDRWTGGSFQGTPILNNGVDDPVYWNGNTASNLATLPGWTAGTKARWMRPFGAFIVAGGMTIGGTEYPHLLQWSAQATAGNLPSTWTASDTNLAGDNPGLVSDGEMVDAVAWNDSLFVFKEDAVWLMRFLPESNAVFQFNRVPGSGMLFRGCGVATPKGVVVLTAGDVIIHNGVQEVSIGDARVRKSLFELMNTENWKRCFLAVNDYYKEVWVCIPSVGKAACDYAYTWNWEENKWGIRRLPDVTYAASGLVPPSLATETWNDQTLTWEEQDEAWVEGGYSENQARMIVCTSDQKIGLVDQGDEDFGMAISTRLERIGMAFDDPDTFKLFKEAALSIDSRTGTQLSIQFGAHVLPDESPTWKTARIWTQGTSRKIYDFASGPYIDMRIGSSVGEYWRIRSMVLDIQPQGKY